MRTPGARDKSQRTRLDFVTHIMLLMTSEGGGKVDDMLHGRELRRWQRIRLVHSLNMQHGVELSHTEKMRMYRREMQALYGECPEERTYFQDQADCRAIFGPMLNPDLVYLRGIELEIAIRDRSLCRAAGDYKSMVAISKHIMELMRLNSIENKDLDNETNKPVTINMQINLGDGTTKTQAIDLDRLNKLRPVDIENLVSSMDEPAVGIEQMEEMLKLRDGENTDQV